MTNEQQATAILTELFAGQVIPDGVEVTDEIVSFWLSTASSVICWHGISLSLMEIDAVNQRIYCHASLDSLQTDLGFNRAMKEAFPKAKT